MKDFSVVVQTSVIEQLAIKERTKWFDPYVAGIQPVKLTPHGVLAFLRGFKMRYTEDVILISNSSQEEISILDAAKYFAGSSSYPRTVKDYQDFLLLNGSRSLNRIGIKATARQVYDARRQIDVVFRRIAWVGVDRGSKTSVRCPGCGSFSSVDYGPYYSCEMCGKTFIEGQNANPFSDPFPGTTTGRYKRGQILIEPKREKFYKPKYEGLEASYKVFDEYSDDSDELLRRKKSGFPKENKESVIKVVSHRTKRKIILKD